MCKDDLRRRFVLGREAYDDEVKSGVSSRLLELEAAEQAHEDGTVEAAFLTQQQISRMTASDVAPEMCATRATTVVARLDALVGVLQSLGYDQPQIRVLLRALSSHAPSLVREAFAIYDVLGHGYVNRLELAQSLAPIRRVLTSHEAELFEQSLHNFSADTDPTVAFNEVSQSAQAMQPLLALSSCGRSLI